MTQLDGPELAHYRDEPAQMPSGSPGKNGLLTLRFERRGDRSVLARIDRRAPMHAQQALYWDEHLPGLPCVYMITTSGCILQGDRLDIGVLVGAGAMAHVTTQSATKIHQMDANFAALSQQLTLADGAYLELLPGPVIPHRHSRFRAHTQVAVADSATLVSAEILLPGRKHHGDRGELFEFDVYSSTVTATRPDGTQLFTESFIAEPWRHPVRQAGLMGNFDVLASVTLLTPPNHADRIFDKVVPGTDSDIMAGACRLPHDAGLSYKVIGMETEPVKSKVRAFWALARQEVLGAAIPAPRLWELRIGSASVVLLPVELLIVAEAINRRPLFTVAGNDVPLIVILLVAGAALGAVAGMGDRIRRASAGQVVDRAGGGREVPVRIRLLTVTGVPAAGVPKITSTVKLMPAIPDLDVLARLEVRCGGEPG